MSRQLLGEISEAEDQRTGGRGVDAGLADPAHDIAGGLFGRAPAAVRGERAALEARAILPLRRDLRVEAVQPRVAVELAERGVADGRGMVDEALAKAGASFRSRQGLGIDLVAPQ